VKYQGSLLGFVAVALLLSSGVRASLVTGQSMTPAISAGDIVVTLRPSVGERFKVGTILLYERGGEQLLHRVVAIDGEGLWMKGDASVDRDSEAVQRAAVHGTLLLVIPTSLPWRGFTAAARFTRSISLDLSLASAPGSSMQLESTRLFGSDGQGRVTVGGYETWTLLLYGCTSSGTGCAASYELRINPEQFIALLPATGSVGTSGQSLARSLRVNTRCRAAALASGSWTEMSDLLTAEWDATSAATGQLAISDLASARAGVRCEVRATLLGVVSSSGGSVSLPLIWGPA
jgi:signal peptidase